MEDEFDLVKKHLETFTTTSEKIKYLIDKKTDYLQNKNMAVDDWFTSFDEKCDLEINRLKEHQKLNDLQKTKSSAKEDTFIKGFREERGKEYAKNLLNFPRAEGDSKGCEREKNQKQLGLTIDRATLFLDYLFKRAKIDCKNTEKAKVIAFLTGYSEKKIAQAFSRLEKEKLEFVDNTNASEKFSTDIKIIRNYFKTLRLDEIQQKIDNDLELDSE